MIVRHLFFVLRSWQPGFVSSLFPTYQQSFVCVEFPKKTVYQVWTKYQETGTVHDRPRSGRKRKITTQDEKKIVKKARQEKSAQKISLESRKCKKSYSVTLVKRTLKKYKFFYLPKIKIRPLTLVHKEKRIAYATEMEHADWKSVVFTDEKTFWLGTTTTHCWQQLDDRKVV
jgi:transposase